MDFDFEAKYNAEDEERQRRIESKGIMSSTIPKERGKHSVVCRHYLSGTCMKGDTCDFLHQFDLSRMPECTNFLKNGFCDIVGCNFKHVAPEERVPCTDYRWGFCPLGPSCRRRHDQIIAPPDIVPDWFLKNILESVDGLPGLTTEMDKSLQKLLVEERTEILKQQQQNLQLDSTSELNYDALTGATSAKTISRPTHNMDARIPNLPMKPDGAIKVFVIKSHSSHNIHVSVLHGVWATSISNSQKFEKAFHEYDHVIFLFSANESGGFQGYARMHSAPNKSILPGLWGHFSSKLGPNFYVDWLKQCRVPFEVFSSLRNPLNENHPLKKSRDGQELPTDLAVEICHTLWLSPSVDLLAGTDYANQPRNILH